MKNKNSKLKLLPSAFYEDTNVNVELLRHFFEITPQTSSFLKVIAKLAKHEVPRTFEERISLISLNLPDPSFREKWYGEVNSKKSHSK